MRARIGWERALAIRGSTKSSDERAMTADLSPSENDAFGPFYYAFTSAPDYEHGTWSRVRAKAPRRRFRPGAVPSASERMFVCDENQIGAPATRPRPGAWHRRWSFGAPPRYPPSPAPTTGGSDDARDGGGAYGALIDAGERLAETSNRCWRGELPLDRVQERAEEVLAIDALLRELSS